MAVDAIKLTREIATYMDPKYKATEVRPGLSNLSDDELVKAAGGRLIIYSQCNILQVSK